MSIKNFLLGAILLLTILLNFYQFDKNPPGLYIDEVSIGVNAYSILKTGKDEYGTKFPVYFRSLGDYKLPVYIYLTVASMALFGKNEFAVRFPSAFFGTLSVIFLYLLIRKLLKYDLVFPKQLKGKFPLLFIFLLSVSPWFMQFVGPAFEVTVAFFFFYTACYLFLLSEKYDKFWLYLVSLILLTVSVYTYHSYKIFTPIILLLIFIKFIRDRYSRQGQLLKIIVLFFFAVPVVYAYLPAAANTRFMQTSAFTSLSFEDVIIFARNYISYFSTDFLYNFGDGMNRHQFINFGVMARFSFPFLLVGIFSLFKLKKSNLKYTVLGLLVFAPVPASLALPSPHALRSLSIVVPYTLLISYGIFITLKKFTRFRLITSSVLALAFVYEFSIYLHFAFFHYPQIALIDWGGNYKEVVQKASKLKNQYKTIVVDERLSYTMQYARFYDDSLKLTQVRPGLNTKNSDDLPILLITDNLTGQTVPSDKLLDNVYLSNINKDIFAQFWEL